MYTLYVPLFQECQKQKIWKKHIEQVEYKLTYYIYTCKHKIHTYYIYIIMINYVY